MCYSLRRGCSYAVAVQLTPGDDFSSLRMMAPFYLPVCLNIRCRIGPIYVQLCDCVTYHNTGFASDASLAAGFGLPLTYFTGLKYTVQSSHFPILCPQSSTFCVDPASAWDAYSNLSSSVLSPFSHPYPSKSLLSRSNLLCPQSSTFCIDLSSACDTSSSSPPSALSPSSHSYPSTSLICRSTLLCSVAGLCR